MTARPAMCCIPPPVVWPPGFPTTYPRPWSPVSPYPYIPHPYVPYPDDSYARGRAAGERSEQERIRIRLQQMGVAEYVIAEILGCFTPYPHPLHKKVTGVEQVLGRIPH